MPHKLETDQVETWVKRGKRDEYPDILTIRIKNPTPEQTQALTLFFEAIKGHEFLVGKPELHRTAAYICW